MSVEQLENNISQSELEEWQEYYTIEPFSEDRNEIQMAVLTGMIANYMGSKSTIESFFITGKKQKKAIDSFSADEINKIAGV